MRLGHYRFTRDAENGWRWHRWVCNDGMRAIYRATPWGAWLALCRWYRRDPRGHWPGCDGSHHRSEVCPGH